MSGFQTSRNILAIFVPGIKQDGLKMVLSFQTRVSTLLCSLIRVCTLCASGIMLTIGIMRSQREHVFKRLPVLWTIYRLK